MSTTTVPEAPDNPPRDYYWADKPELAVGELADITIRRAKITGVDNAAYHLADVDGHDLVLPYDFADLAITRVAPAQWPPQVGDLWRDAGGRRWFATETTIDHFPDGIAMVPVVFGPGMVHPGVLLQSCGPVELLYREGFTPSIAEPVPGAVPAPVGWRGATTQTIAAGLRELADFIDAHPEFPLPYGPASLTYSLQGADGVAQIRQVADSLGVEVHTSAHDIAGNVHYNLDRMFGPVELHMYHIRPATAPPAVEEPDGEDTEQSGGEDR